MKPTHLLTLAALFCGASLLPAQVTSPLGYDSTEGGTTHGYILGNRIGLTWQQIDATLRNQVFTANSIAWRRDGAQQAGTDYGARTMEMEIFLGESDLTQISTNHAGNYTNTPTNVLVKKTVNAPDWNPAPASTPAPFDFVVPFDSSYIHLGTADFLWEVRVTANSYSGTAFTNYPYDFQYVVPNGSFNAAPTPSTNTRLGFGCSLNGRNLSLDASLFNHGIKFRLTQDVTNAPPSSAVSCFVGLQDRNATVPGWCENVRTDTLLNFPLGVSGTNGALSMMIDNIVYDPAFIGLPLYSQAYTANAGSVLLTNGVEFVAGADPAYPKVGRVYTYDTTTGSTTSGPWTGGIIAQFK